MYVIVCVPNKHQLIFWSTHETCLVGSNKIHPCYYGMEQEEVLDGQANLD